MLLQSNRDVRMFVITVLLSSSGRLSRYPLHVELALGGGTVPQVKVDKALVRDVGLFSHLLEVLNHVRAHPEGNLFFELPGVGIRPGLHLGQVVFLFHITISCKTWLRSP